MFLFLLFGARSLICLSDIPFFYFWNVCWLHVLHCADYPHLFHLGPVTTAIWLLSFDPINLSIWLMLLQFIITYTLFGFRLNLCIWNLCDLHLFTASLSLTFAATTICCPEWSNIKYTRMPPPVYQNMVNLILGFPIWRCPNIFMDVVMSNIVVLTVRFLDMAKFTTLTPLSLLISCKFSFSIVVSRMSSLLTLALKSTTFSYGI
jgi:hypothetical protein